MVYAGLIVGQRGCFVQPAACSTCYAQLDRPNALNCLCNVWNSIMKGGKVREFPLLNLKQRSRGTFENCVDLSRMLVSVFSKRRRLKTFVLLLALSLCTVYLWGTACDLSQGIPRLCLCKCGRGERRKSLRGEHFVLVLDFYNLASWLNLVG